MRLFNAVFLGMYFCSLMKRSANAGCQDQDPNCWKQKNYCSRYDHVQQTCPLTCKLCTPGLTPTAASSTSSHLPSSSSPPLSSPLSTSMTSVQELSPQPSTIKVLKSSAVGNVDNNHNRTSENNNPTDESSSPMTAVHKVSPPPSTSLAVLKSSFVGNVDNNPSKTSEDITPTTKSSAQRINISLTTISMLTGFLWSYNLRRL